MPTADETLSNRVSQGARGVRRAQLRRLLVVAPAGHTRERRLGRHNLGIDYVDHLVRLDVDVHLVRGLVDSGESVFGQDN